VTVVTSTVFSSCQPSAAASRPSFARAAASGLYTVWSAGFAGLPQHTLKRSTMARTDIDGWPLGPQDGTSG
jgi:hypothetical protein